MDRSFYTNYLKSPQWKAKRELWFAKFGKYCRACGKTTGPIQLHHVTYDRLGNERLSDLVALCAECHRGAEKFHRLLGGRGDRRAATAAFIRKRKNERRK